MNILQIIKLKKEYKELEARINNLTAFLNTDEWKILSDREKEMLLSQYHAMNVYALVLGDRISFYEGKPLIFEWKCKKKMNHYSNGGVNNE